MIPRSDLAADVRRALGRARVVLLTGPRASGKTTLARTLADPDSPGWFDAANPQDARRLEQPLETLGRLDGTVVIDEAQRVPAVMPALRDLVGRSDRPGQFLLVGSAAPSLLRQAGEALPGRVERIEIAGFDLREACATGVEDAPGRLWLRGGYPPSWLAPTDAASLVWRLDAIAKHVEAELPQLGYSIAAPAMLRFWRMLAHLHGEVWNGADLARSLGVSEPTVRRWLEALAETRMVRLLQPWHANLGKRQVRSPKVYLRDPGLLHALLDVTTMDELLAHPRCGASWAGYALEQVLRLAKPDDAYFWATHQGAALDLLLLKGSQRVGIDFTRAVAPQVTRSMRIAADDLDLDVLYVVYPGPHRFHLASGIEAVPLTALLPGS